MTTKTPLDSLSSAIDGTVDVYAAIADAMTEVRFGDVDGEVTEKIQDALVGAIVALRHVQKEMREACVGFPSAEAAARVRQ